MTGRPQNGIYLVLDGECIQLPLDEEIIVAAIEKIRAPLARATAAAAEDDLGNKIALALEAGIPKTAPEIARSRFVRRRREVVEEALAADHRFVRVPAPPGRSSRAEVWGLARQGAEGLVPTRPWDDRLRAGETA